MDPLEVRGSMISRLWNSGSSDLRDSGLSGGDRVYKQKGEGLNLPLSYSNGCINVIINIKLNIVDHFPQ
jgi:hypothetical protein